MTDLVRHTIAPLTIGLSIAVSLAVAARVLASTLMVNEVAIAVMGGLVIANATPVGTGAAPGVAYATRQLLRAGIVLLGAQLSFAAVLTAGLSALGLVVALVFVTLVGILLAARALRLDPRLGLLVAVGTAICGNTAILATAPIVKARGRDVSVAVATITLFGTAAVFVYPALGLLLDLDPKLFGVWAGTAVNDTSQVVAAGFAYGEEAGQVATVVKLTRNTLLAPVLVLVVVWCARRSDGAEASRGSAARLREALPLFVLGFLAMALLNTLGVLDASPLGGRLPHVLADAGRFLVLVALAGVGLSTRLRPLREVGVRPIGLGLAGGVLLSALSLGTLTLMDV